MRRDQSPEVVRCPVISIIRHLYFVEAVPVCDIGKELKSLGVVNRRGRSLPRSIVLEAIYSVHHHIVALMPNTFESG
jgi:hypothetical protein